MGENLEEGRSMSSIDRTAAEHYERNQIETSWEKSEVTGHNSRGGDLGIGMAESASAEWTDEKHSLYLKSMEASFVRQLHKHEYHPMDILGWHSEDKFPMPNSSLQSNANNHTHSSQFKVLQSGCWKKINYENAQPKLDIEDGSQVLLDNQWIQHFRSTGKFQEATLPDLHSGGRKMESCGAAMSSKKLHACYSHPCHQDYGGSTTEVSDQNFMDENHGQMQRSKLCKPKRKRTAATNAVIKDLLS